MTLARGRGALDGGEKADELLMPVLRHAAPLAAPDDGSVEDVECGEQGGCAVATVVVGHGSTCSSLSDWVACGRAQAAAQ